MWVATSAGLNRLDGKQVDLISGPEQELYATNILFSMQDSNSRIWTGNYDALYRLSEDLTTGEKFSLPSSSQVEYDKNFALDLIEDEDGYWIISWEGLFKLDPEEKDIQSFSSMQHLRKSKVYVQKALSLGQTIWLATSKGLYHFNKANLKLTKLAISELVDDKPIRSILKLDGGQLLVTGEEGLFIIETGNLNTPPKLVFESSAAITDMTRFNRQVFFSQADKLLSFNLESQQTTHLFSLSEILPKYTNYHINKLFLDQNKKLWIGTNSQGAFVWDPNSLYFQSLSAKTMKPELLQGNGSVWTFVEDTRGNYWLGSDEGLDYFDQENKTITRVLDENHPALSSSQARIFGIKPAGNILWLASGDGLIRYDHLSKQVSVYRPSFQPSNYELFVYSITIVPEGNIWLATDSGPLKFNPHEKTFSYENNLISQENQEIASLVRYFEDRLWVGFTDRLVIYDYNNNTIEKVISVQHKMKSSELYVSDFYKDGNNIWISFGGEGIYVYDISKETPALENHFSPRTGFVDGIVFSLLPHKHFLWAGTHSGLVRINRNTGHFKVFDYYDGLPSNEFNEGAAYISSKGEMLFGGANGIIFVSPEKLESKSQAPKPSISKIQIQDRTLIAASKDLTTTTLQLSESEKLIQVDITTHDYLKPNQWQYEYWLSGATAKAKIKTWDDEITLANFNTGETTLHIRTYLPGEDIYSEETQLQFNMASPIWQSTELNQVLYLMVPLLLVLLLYRRVKIKKLLFSLQHQLKNKEAQLDLVLHDQRRGIWEWKLIGQDIMQSEIIISFSQNNKVALSLENYITIVHENDIEHIRLSWFEFLSGRRPEFSESYRIFFFDNWVWSNIYGSIIEYNSKGLPSKAIGSWQDISEEKVYEENLKLYKRAIQSTQDIIVIANHKLDIVSVNKAYSTTTGFPAQEILNKNLLKIGKKKFSYELVKRLHYYTIKSGSWQGELMIPRQSGLSYPANVSIDVVKNESNRKSYVIVISDISQSTSQKSIQAESLYLDNLTGLPNSALADDRLTHAIDHANQQGSNVTLVLFALDSFNLLEQTFDTTTIDGLISAVSQSISSHLCEDETLARYAKNRFLLILEENDEFNTIVFKVDKLLKGVNSQVSAFAQGTALSVSAGISRFPDDANNCKALLRLANKALDLAKERGLQQYRYYNKEQQQIASDQVAMKNALINALDNEQFFLVFQPKLRLDTELCVGFEVLIRWRTNDGSVLYPSQFLEIAKRSGLIRQLTEWMIAESSRVLSQWNQAGFSTAISINLTPHGSYADTGIEFLLNMLDEYGLDSSLIHVEINEEDLAKQQEETFGLIRQLAKHGVKVTVDNFGQWLLPISNFGHLPIYAVKLARSYTREIVASSQGEAIAQSITHLCNQFDIIATAKSIETSEQKDALIKVGCKFGQGYLFSDPLTEKEALSYLEIKSGN